MKHNFVRLAMSGIIAATMIACSGGPTSLKPESTVVKGKLGDCFTVVDREYKLKGSSKWDAQITIELERTNAALPFIYKPNQVCYYSGDSSKDGVGIGLEFLDKDGDIVYKTDLTSYYELYNKLASNESVIELVKLSPGETGSVEFEIPREDIKDAVSFRVVTAFEPAKEGEDRIVSYSGSSSSSEDEMISESMDVSDSSSSRGSSSTNWDDILDSYDKLVTKYISVAKKSKNGDMSAYAELADLMSEAQTITDKIGNASDEMTAAQMARYTKIMAKMATAAQ